MTVKLKHTDLEAILRPFWAHLGVLWRPLGGHFGHLGANLSQHRAILGQVGATLGQHNPNMRNPSGWVYKAAPDIEKQQEATAKPQLTSFWPQDHSGRGIIILEN